MEKKKAFLCQAANRITIIDLKALDDISLDLFLWIKLCSEKEYQKLNYSRNSSIENIVQNLAKLSVLLYRYQQKVKKGGDHEL